MDMMLKVLSIGGTGILTFLGLYVTVNPPKKKGGIRTWILASFALIGIVSAVANVVLSERTDASLKEMLIGGSNYCFYSAEIVAPQDIEAKVPLWIKCTGPVYNLAVWFSPADVAGDPNNPRYWSIGGQHFSEALPGGVRAGIALARGKYRIEMSARNGTVVENLEIKEEGGRLLQVLEVFRHPEGKIYHQ